MKKTLSQRVSEVSKRKAKKRKAERKHRARPTPRWLLKRADIDEVARRRCLMILSVLSGERPVTDVVQEAKISRQTYYQLEARSVKAMLSVLLPGGESTSQAESQGRRIEELEEKVKRLEQDKRRSDRLLYVTRQVLKPGPVTSGVGRPPKKRGPSSTKVGRKPSKPSKPAMSSSSESAVSSTHFSPASPSTPASTDSAP